MELMQLGLDETEKFHTNSSAREQNKFSSVLRKLRIVSEERMFLSHGFSDFDYSS